MTPIGLARPLRSAQTAAALALRTLPGGLAVALTPVAASAATCVCPTPNLPESPATPLLLVAGGVVAAVFLAFLRRRGSLPALLVSVLAVVVLAGVFAGSIAAGASTATCSCAPGGGGSPGGVQALSTTTPSTGAELPWVDALILIGGGGVITLISFPRWRRSPRPPVDPS